VDFLRRQDARPVSRLKGVNADPCEAQCITKREHLAIYATHDDRRQNGARICVSGRRRVIIVRPMVFSFHGVSLHASDH
jgi:hypothetical protein